MRGWRCWYWCSSSAGITFPNYLKRKKQKINFQELFPAFRCNLFCSSKPLTKKDLHCNRGYENWIHKLKWNGLKPVFKFKNRLAFRLNIKWKYFYRYFICRQFRGFQYSSITIQKLFSSSTKISQSKPIEIAQISTVRTVNFHSSFPSITTEKGQWRILKFRIRRTGSTFTGNP